MNGALKADMTSLDHFFLLFFFQPIALHKSTLISVFSLRWLTPFPFCFWHLHWNSFPSSSSFLAICSFTSCSFFKHSSLSLSPLVGFDSCCLLMCAAPSPFLILCFVILLCLRSQASFTKQTASPEWNLNLNFELWATLFTLRENLPSDEATVYTRKCSHAYLHRHTPSRYCHLSSFLNISFYSERNIVWCIQSAARDHCEPQS